MHQIQMKREAELQQLNQTLKAKIEKERELDQENEFLRGQLLTNKKQQTKLKQAVARMYNMLKQKHLTNREMQSFEKDLETAWAHNSKEESPDKASDLDSLLMDDSQTGQN